jgi:hypothetical protein
MSDIQGLRAQLKDTRPAPSSSSGGGIPFWAIAAGAAALGFAIVLFAPRFYTAPRTAALPGVQVTPHADPADSAPAVTPNPAGGAPAIAPNPAGSPSRYAGKTPEEVVRTVDIVCDERALLVRNAAPAAAGHKITAADEKLHCFLTEAPARFCAANLKRKATADIINYFKGIEYTNTAISVAAKLKGVRPDGARPQDTVLAAATIDPRVVDAIEGLMRAGYLTKAHREEIGANVPREIKDRLARIIGSTPACPPPPWWSSFL